MARPRAEGMNYFPLDCQLDEKFEVLENAFGNDGFSVAVKAYQVIYMTAKGELDVSRDIMCETYARRAHVTLSRWREIIRAAADIGLFDAEKLNLGTLTSNGIKKRLAKVRKERQKARVRSSGVIRRKTPEETPKKGGKERKGKEKETLSLKEREEAPAPRDALPPTLCAEAREELQLALSEWRNHLRAQGKTFTREAELALVDSYQGKPWEHLVRDIRFSMARASKSIIQAGAEFKIRRRNREQREAPPSKSVQVVELVESLGEKFAVKVNQPRKEARA